MTETNFKRVIMGGLPLLLEGSRSTNFVLYIYKYISVLCSKCAFARIFVQKTVLHILLCFHDKSIVVDR